MIPASKQILIDILLFAAPSATMPEKRQRCLERIANDEN
jgi:hypothetical protein